MGPAVLPGVGTGQIRVAQIGCRSLLTPIKAQEDEAVPPPASKPVAEGQTSTPVAKVPSPASPPAPSTGSIKDAISSFSKGQLLSFFVDLLPPCTNQVVAFVICSASALMSNVFT